MDPGEVSQELQDLTDIEEMLITQVFPIVSMYNLPGRQYVYRGNIINFSVPIGCIRKVMQALRWLKANNKFYQDIKIDSDVLQMLPENDLIEMHLSQLIDNNDRPNEQHLDQVDDENNEDNEDNFISQTFILLLPNKHSEERAINEILNRMHNDRERVVIDYPRNEIFPINEFHTCGYIARAFPTLYPWQTADLNDYWVKEIKLAEYFKHLLIYKDGWFTYHPP
ncbi:hypothetical protein C1646_770097 [Rhizophagus diaphanus]|nr:hypothetical protein C1646_770097 [Rhizophagus diaphanus] [Rhizophagus sp. MUCL 43196]